MNLESVTQTRGATQQSADCNARLLARTTTEIRSTGRSSDISTHAPWRPTFMGGRWGTWGSKGLRCGHASSRPHRGTCSQSASASAKAIGSSMQTTRAVVGWSSARGGGGVYIRQVLKLAVRVPVRAGPGHLEDMAQWRWVRHRMGGGFPRKAFYAHPALQADPWDSQAVTRAAQRL